MGHGSVVLKTVSFTLNTVSYALKNTSFARNKVTFVLNTVRFVVYLLRLSAQRLYKLIIPIFLGWSMAAAAKVVCMHAITR